MCDQGHPSGTIFTPLSHLHTIIHLNRNVGKRPPTQPLTQEQSEKNWQPALSRSGGTKGLSLPVHPTVQINPIGLE